MMSLLILGFLQAAGGAEVDQALEKFRSAYASPDVSARAAAVAGLAAIRHERVLRRLAVLLLADEKEVRIAAARGLGGFQEHRKAAASALAGALEPNRKARMYEVQVAILQALGELKEETALPAIHRCLRQRETTVATAAVEAAERIHRMELSFDPLIETLKHCEKMSEENSGGGGTGLIAIPGGGEETKHAKALKSQILKTLQKWTGEKWPTAGEWGIWWERHQKKAGLRRPPGR